MLQRSISVIRIILLVGFVSLAVAFAADQYFLTRGVVRFLCISCLGLDS